MSAQITVTVYTFEELSDKARRRACSAIEPRIYDDEGYWHRVAWEDFCNRIDEGVPYAWDELPERVYLQVGFKDAYRYHGGRRGEYIRAAFEKYLAKEWDALTVDEGWVADYCQEHEILFFESGRIACEDGDVVA